MENRVELTNRIVHIAQNKLPEFSGSHKALIVNITNRDRSDSEYGNMEIFFWHPKRCMLVGHACPKQEDNREEKAYKIDCNHSWKWKHMDFMPHGNWEIISSQLVNLSEIGSEDGLFFIKLDEKHHFSF